MESNPQQSNNAVNYMTAKQIHKFETLCGISGCIGTAVKILDKIKLAQSSKEIDDILIEFEHLAEIDSKAWEACEKVGKRRMPYGNG